MARTRLYCTILLALVLAIVAPPTFFLANVWWHDGRVPLVVPTAGTDDASHMNSNRPAEVIAVAAETVAAEQQLVALIRRATAEHTHISISGAHHSMGGHTIYPGALVLDILPFNRMTFDAEHRLLTVGAGARWSEIIPYLDHLGYSVAIMQTNNDFSVGGSLSVNCHGWQNDAPPIASTVESFRLLLASGEIKTCSRTENQELFSKTLGGYGLFGVMREVQLRVVPNEYYVAEAHRVAPSGYNRLYHELTRNRADVGMAYGRINVAPNGFLEDGILTLLRRQSTSRPVVDSLTDEAPSVLKRTVFRGGIGSSYGKNLRWWLEKTMGETAGKLLSRNQIMNEPSNLYASRNSGSTDILQEYFLPVERMGEFVARARPIFLKHHPEILNITVRNVEPDHDTFLRYAREEVFGLVMLFHQERTQAADQAMEALTRELIETALACGGTYYLPYRAHATPAQFLRAYPQAPEFFAAKRHYDPAGIFENQFFLNYGAALANVPAAAAP